MKKLSIIITGLFLTVAGICAQDTSVIRYDSLSNFVGKDALAYKGQEFYLKGLDKTSRSYGYTGFILDYKKDDDILNDEKNIYKPNENYNSRYEDLAGRYFHVSDVIPHPKANTSEDYKNIFYLKLQELSSGDIVYYKYNTKSDFTFPFVVRGFLEKQKELLAGKEFVIPDNVLKLSRNIMTGSALKFETGEEWKCVDVTIDNIANEISLLMQNKHGVKTTIPYSYLQVEEGMKKMYTAAEAATYTKKFNSNNFRRILQNKIRNGMTKEMTRLAWGEPMEIKESGKNEQWIYPAGRLTFSGDKIINSK